MINHRRLLGLGLFALAATLASAQDQTGQPAPSAATPAPEAPTSNAWLLGRTYGEVGGFLERLRGLPGSTTAAAPDLAVNLPLGDNFDYSATTFYEHGTTAGYRLNEESLGNSLTAYYKFGSIAPFGSVGFGYDWERQTIQNIPGNYDHLFVDVAGGFEMPVSDSTSLRLTLANYDSLHKPSERDLRYGLSANAWLNSVLGTYAGADYKEAYNGEKSSVIFSAGFRFLFE